MQEYLQQRKSTGQFPGPAGSQQPLAQLKSSPLGLPYSQQAHNLSSNNLQPHYGPAHQWPPVALPSQSASQLLHITSYSQPHYNFNHFLPAPAPTHQHFSVVPAALPPQPVPQPLHHYEAHIEHEVSLISQYPILNKRKADVSRAFVMDHTITTGNRTTLSGAQTARRRATSSELAWGQPMRMVAFPDALSATLRATTLKHARRWLEHRRLPCIILFPAEPIVHLFSIRRTLETYLVSPAMRSGPGPGNFRA